MVVGIRPYTIIALKYAIPVTLTMTGFAGLFCRYSHRLDTLKSVTGRNPSPILVIVPMASAGEFKVDMEPGEHASPSLRETDTESNAVP
jgi:hypothetical protein